MILKSKQKILWITRTAVFIALLIASQAATAPLGNTLITGSIVNLLLIVSGMTGGLASGLSVACVSAVIAKLLGVGPLLWGIVPFQIAGNATLVLLWHFIGNRSIGGKRYVAYIAALVAAAVAKFLVLYIGVVHIAIPVFLGLPAPQAAVISHMFSIPQLITASIGGAVAAIILPRLTQAIASKWE
jgi:hypothetical protein